MGSTALDCFRKLSRAKYLVRRLEKEGAEIRLMSGRAMLVYGPICLVPMCLSSMQYAIGLCNTGVPIPMECIKMPSLVL